MKVRCVSNRATTEQVQKFGLDPRIGHVCSIAPGMSYTVLALTAYPSPGIFGAGVSLDIVDDSDRPEACPLFLFDLVDPRLSKYWIARKFPDSSLAFWPESFFQPCYHDHLMDGVPQVVEDFLRVRALLEGEFES